MHNENIAAGASASARRFLRSLYVEAHTAEQPFSLTQTHRNPRHAARRRSVRHHVLVEVFFFFTE